MKIHTLVCLMFAVCLVACGPDISAWKGDYSGTAVINTGRLPMPFTGTLAISDGAKFQVTSVASGTPSQSFSCAINAAMVDSNQVTFTGPLECDLVATPTDACTYKVTVNNGTLTRNQNAIEGTINGRMASTCTVGSSKAEDFSMTVSGVRK